MGYDKEREAVKAVYPYQAWRDKVDKMPDNQVIALYKRFQRQNKLK